MAQVRTIAQEHRPEEPTPELRIKVERGQRGSYGWEITASAPGHDVDDLIDVVKGADDRLRVEFGPASDEPTGPRAA